jgi:hypothetical protein
VVNSIKTLTLVGALLSASILLGGSAFAATVRLAPEPETTNIASFGVFGGGQGAIFPSHPEILGSSNIVANFDPVSRALRFDSMSLEHGAFSVSFGPKNGLCFRGLTFHLPEGGELPHTTTDAGGRFTMSFTVALTYEFTAAIFGCGSFEPRSLTATWNATGTVTIDAPSGRTRLTDMTVSVSNPSQPSTVDNGTLTLNLWDGFGLIETPKLQRVGDPIKLIGSDITPGSILRVYVNTPRGILDVIPDGLAPTATTSTTWEGVLPFPWPLPAPDAFELGFGFMQAILVRTDRGFDRSNAVPRVLIGNVDLGVPSIIQIGPVNGLTSLAPSSWSPAVAVANVESALVPGQPYFMGVSSGPFFAGGVFTGQDPVVNIFSAAGNCAPDGGVVPSSRGDTFIGFTIPPACPTGPGAFQVVNRKNGRASNIVYAPLGALIRIDSVILLGRSVQVTGAGFSAFTTLNLFATQQGTGAGINFGGQLPNGQPRIELTSMTPTSLTFQLPPDAAAGPAFVEALNPPFIPFTSSLSRSSAGAFTIP